MTQYPLPSPLLIVYIMIPNLTDGLTRLLMHPTFLGVVTTPTVAMLPVLCLVRQRAVVISALLAVSTGLTRKYRWLDRLLGKWPVHAIRRAGRLLLCPTLRKLILVAGTRWATLLSTLRFVCSIGMTTGWGLVSPPLATGVIGALTGVVIMDRPCAVLQVLSTISLEMSLWKTEEGAPPLCSMASPRLISGRPKMRSLTSFSSVYDLWFDELG